MNAIHIKHAFLSHCGAPIVRGGSFIQDEASAQAVLPNRMHYAHHPFIATSRNSDAAFATAGEC